MLVSLEPRVMLSCSNAVYNCHHHCHLHLGLHLCKEEEEKQMSFCANPIEQHTRLSVFSAWCISSPSCSTNGSLELKLLDILWRRAWKFLLEMHLACAVRPVCLNKFHVGLGTAAGDAMPGCLMSFLSLSSSALDQTLACTFGGMSIYVSEMSRSAWWLCYGLCYYQPSMTSTKDFVSAAWINLMAEIFCNWNLIHFLKSYSFGYIQENRWDFEHEWDL